ncbi:MAG TPA: hypothetical protein VFX58_09880 [Chitinophagaceae bacterium]|nr:hypothetical protein [Chitinophagaceae bacterium]
MKLILSILSLGLLVLAKTTFLNHPSIPAELWGKWTLKNPGCGLTATLEVKKNGHYSYSIMPGKKLTGKLLPVQPGKIELVTKARKGNGDTTRVNYRVRNERLELVVTSRAGRNNHAILSGLDNTDVHWIGCQ